MVNYGLAANGLEDLILKDVFIVRYTE